MAKGEIKKIISTVQYMYVYLLFYFFIQLRMISALIQKLTETYIYDVGR